MLTYFYTPSKGSLRPSRRAAAHLGLIVITALIAATDTHAQLPLSYSEAVRIAIDSEPGTQALQARADGFREHSISAGQLPDPQLRVGMGNLPIESGGFSTEGMTQAQLGYRQAFPPGDTRAASTRQLLAMAEQMDKSAQSRIRDVQAGVQHLWLESYYWHQAQIEVTDARVYFDDLVNVTRSLFAAGRSGQSDVLLAELEVSRLDDRLIGIKRQQDRNRAGLSEWIGDAAYRPVDDTLPALGEPPPLGQLNARLDGHPVLLASGARIAAGSAGIDLAKERYKPGWAVDLGYGYRDGRLVTGESRSDFVSLSFTVDLPLFRADRQDRKLSAALSEHQAAELSREQLRRQLHSRLQSEYAQWQNLSQRLELYEGSILPQSQERAQAALLAYQSRSGSFFDVMRARIDVLETRLSLKKIEVERAQSRVALASFEGINP